jgi:hypothetical protein
VRLADAMRQVTTDDRGIRCPNKESKSGYKHFLVHRRSGRNGPYKELVREDGSRIGRLLFEFISRTDFELYDL